MAEKRTEQIAVRITLETKQTLQEEARKLDWTVSKLVERILREWTEGAKDGSTGSIKYIGQNSFFYSDRN